jgi:hypothetical protein
VDGNNCLFQTPNSKPKTVATLARAIYLALDSHWGNKNKRDKLSHLIRVSIAVVLTRIVGDCPA